MINDYITQAKNILENYSGDSARLEELYAKAKEENNKSYETSKEQLDKNYYYEKNSAAAQNKLNEKDMANFLASRGLASSGESAQSKINSGISLNNALSALARGNSDALVSLENAKNKRDGEIDLELAGKLTDENKWRAELAVQIAKSDSEAAKAAANNAAGKTDTAAPGQTGQEPGYEPLISAKDLAKNIITSVSGGVRITTAEQMSAIKDYLYKLENDDNVSGDYLKELMINLKAAGYSEITDNEYLAGQLAEKASAYFKSLYSQMKEVFYKSNNSAKTADEKAISYARQTTIDYIYMHSRTVGEFENVCKKLDFTREHINDFYKRLENSDKKVTIGSALK